MKDWKAYTQANREAWNQVTPIHQKSRKEDLRKAFETPGFSTLDPHITQALSRIGMQGKRVAQLSCNNGREVISMIHLGAEYGTGFDISDQAIEEANELKVVSGANCDFVCIDAMEIQPRKYKPYDLVYISVGALAWIPDRKLYFQIAVGLLKPSGLLVIDEIHPFTYMLAVPSEDAYHEPYRIEYGYFQREMMINHDGLDYYGGTEYDAKPSYEFPYTLTEIFQALLHNGFQIEAFEEYPEDRSNGFDHLPGTHPIPMSFLLIARKAEVGDSCYLNK